MGQKHRSIPGWEFSAPYYTRKYPSIRDITADHNSSEDKARAIHLPHQCRVSLVNWNSTPMRPTVYYTYTPTFTSLPQPHIPEDVIPYVCVCVCVRACACTCSAVSQSCGSPRHGVGRVDSRQWKENPNTRYTLRTNSKHATISPSS